MRRPQHRRTSVVACALALLLAAAAAQAYTIYLKDGSRLVAQKKYRVAGGRAIFTLQNGTETFVPAAEIDVKRTDEANREDLGDAVVLRDELPQPAPVPRRRPSLTDLAGRRAPAPSAPARRETQRTAPAAAAKTGAGYQDFTTRSREPYANMEVAAELLQLYRGQGVEVQVFAGSRGDRPFVEVTTNSEAAVLQALTASANALVQLRQRRPGKVAALELLMTTPARERAGQFVLTPDLAAELASKKVEVTAFFVRNVQF